MDNKKFSTKDYVLIVFSLMFFAAAIYTIVVGLPYAAIGCFCIFACITITLVQSIAYKPVLQPTETEEYIQLKKQYDENKKVADVRIGLLTAKLEEGTREKEILHKQYKDSVEKLEEIKSKEVEISAKEETEQIEELEIIELPTSESIESIQDTSQEQKMMTAPKTELETAFGGGNI